MRKACTGKTSKQTKWEAKRNKRKKCYFCNLKVIIFVILANLIIEYINNTLYAPTNQISGCRIVKNKQVYHVQLLMEPVF